MPQYLVLPYEDPSDFDAISPGEMQAIIEKYMAWTSRLSAEGRIQTSAKLRDGEGRTLKGAGPKLVVTDGPYAETREVIGGFWLIEATDYGEVVRLCRDHPHLEFGGTLSIRALES